MNCLRIHSNPFHLLIALLCTGLFTVSCVSDSSRTTGQNAQTTTQNDTIEVVTRVMDFVLDDTIPSGWNTFKYANQSEETHFFILEKYPEGKNIDSAKNRIVPLFQEGMNLINAGKGEEAMAKFGGLPEWYSDVAFSGGSGLIAPKYTSITTIKLDPGYYVMECYVKMKGGVFHSSMGMIKAVVVKKEDSGLKPPTPTHVVKVSSDSGYVFDPVITKGRNIFEVRFVDQKVHENFIQHDLNLVQLNEGADLEALEKWMNWSVPGGLQTPVPDGFTFLGGTNEMPSGSTAYFEANLAPGEYAFVAEVPNTMEKNMLVPFTVVP